MHGNDTKKKEKRGKEEGERKLAEKRKKIETILAKKSRIEILGRIKYGEKEIIGTGK